MFYSAFQRYIQIGCIGRLKNKSVDVSILSMLCSTGGYYQTNI